MKTLNALIYQLLRLRPPACPASSWEMIVADKSLDVIFDEDDCRIRKGFGAEKASRLHRIVLNLLKHEKTVKCGIKIKRHKAGLDEKYWKSYWNLDEFTLILPLIILQY